jgi:proteasome lid subunit RPN8/RPN11
MALDIVFTPAAWKSLQAKAQEAYPFEGCGLMIGPLAQEKVVQQIVPLRNVLRDEGRGRFDFAFSAKEFMEEQRTAEKNNLDVVGIYHTHPDHPPKPSATDASQPMLAGWVNVIASVHGGTFKEAKAWWRDDETTPFVETKLLIRE